MNNDMVQCDHAPLLALIVDDNEHHRRLHGLVLRTLDVDVEFAVDGLVALDAVAATSYDLILMDISMPRMDGLSATKILRRMEDEQGRRRTPLDVQKLKQRVEAQKAAISSSTDPDVRRQAAEESLFVRQEVARLRSAPGNQNLVISRELARIEELYEGIASQLVDEALSARVQQLSATARQRLDQGDHQQAESCVNQIRSLVLGEMMRHPAFLIGHFEQLVEERYVAIDKTLHDKHVQVGLAAIKAEDWDGLRRVNAGLIDNRFAAAPAEPLTSKLVGLVRG